MLKEIFKYSTTTQTDIHEIQFDIQEISDKHDTLMPYIDYISTVIELYSNLCLSRNLDAI